MCLYQADGWQAKEDDGGGHDDGVFVLLIDRYSHQHWHECAGN